MDGLCMKTGLITSQIIVSDFRVAPLHVTPAVGRSPAKVIPAEKASPSSVFSMKYPFTSLWPVRRRKLAAVESDDVVLEDDGEGEMGAKRNSNWVLKILQLRALRKDEDRNEIGDEGLKEEEKSCDSDEKCNCGEEEHGVCDDDDDDDTKIVFDNGLFSKMLRRVNLGEARLYAQLCYLGSLAYSVSRIKPGSLLKYHGYHFVTSSLEKQEQAMKAEKEGVVTKIQENEKVSAELEEMEKDLAKTTESIGAPVTAAKPQGMVEETEEKSRENQISAYVAYRIAASAASYLLSHTTSLLPFRSEMREDLSKDNVGNVGKMNRDVASVIATTDSVTSVVAAKEEVKQAVADDLNSTSSTPCQWFVCDDDQTRTRFFVIQGSESLASWQANLFFEPIQFEGSEVLVHRGIYEAAKGIYEQMLPEVRNHIKKHGNHAMFRFTGHSLGGSLSMLVNLMLLIRGDVPPASLLPVVTFGAPAIMCGGDHLLRKLGLPKSHVQSISMHRDIVPRAFSCTYPNHVTELLKAVNGKFRDHPCLENNGLLYFPVGEFLILQPDEKFSPHHELLPSGSGLYLLTCPTSEATEAAKHIQAAQAAFLNKPHPLEILSDRSSYGSEGTILRDHHVNSYLICIQDFIRQELNQVRKTRRIHRRNFLWPLVAPSVNGNIVVGKPAVSSTSSNNGQLNFAGVLHTGRESFRRFSRLLSSRYLHLIIVFLFPVRMLILGAYNMINFH